jgi:hypothetical protein
LVDNHPADQPDQQRQHAEHNQRQVGHPSAEQHVTHTEPVVRDAGPLGTGARHRRLTQSGGSTRVTPWVFGILEFVLGFAVIERTRVGRVALQGIGPRERATEGLGQNRVGRFGVRGELAGLAELRRPDPLGDEGALHTVGTAEGLTRCGVDRRPGHGARRQPRGAVVVLIGAHVILFRALSKQALWTRARHRAPAWRNW